MLLCVENCHPFIAITLILCWLSVTLNHKSCRGNRGFLDCIEVHLPVCEYRTFGKYWQVNIYCLMGGGGGGQIRILGKNLPLAFLLFIVKESKCLCPKEPKFEAKTTTKGLLLFFTERTTQIQHPQQCVLLPTDGNIGTFLTFSEQVWSLKRRRKNQLSFSWLLLSCKDCFVTGNRSVVYAVCSSLMCVPVIWNKGLSWYLW